MKFPESKLAHKYLDGLKGIEIGGSAHNPFGLDTINVDLYPGPDSIYKKQEIELCGEALKVDVVAPGDDLPFANKSFDFVISSHVIEHFYNPIKAMIEWERVARKYIFIIVPHRQRTFDKDRELTPFVTLYNRYVGISSDNDVRDDHWSVWEPETFRELCAMCDFDIVELQDPDDKVGNGFIVVIKL